MVTAPRWIRVVSFLIALLGVFVACSLYLAPAPFLPGVDLAAEGALFLVAMWAARQLAIALALGFAAWRGSPVMLAIVLGIYCLMNIQDALIGVWRGDTGLLIGAAFFTVLSGSMVAMLWRSIQKL